MKVKDINAPVLAGHYNMYPTAEITGNTAPGVSSGDAIQLMEDLAEKVLPRGMRIEWTELSLLQILAGNTAVYIFPLCVLMMFLVLAAQYESWSLPLAIILIVPMCLLFAIFGVWLRGLDNNLFTQIGLVVLMGLACKNAILIVEFAKQLQDAGRNRTDAAIEASRLRLRPILMTSFAFTFGVIPLMLSRGAGAEMRVSIGTAVFFGMLGVTFFGVVLTPVFYVVIRGALERKKAVAKGALPNAAASAGTLLLLLAGASATLFLNGCAVGPNFHPPKTEVSAAFANGSQTNMAPAPTAVTWWRGFNDPLLNGLVDQAVTNNPDLRIATAHVLEARALRMGAVADLFPVANANAGWTKSAVQRGLLALPADPRPTRAEPLQRRLRCHLGTGLLRPCPPCHPGRHRRRRRHRRDTPGRAGHAHLGGRPQLLRTARRAKPIGRGPRQCRQPARDPGHHRSRSSRPAAPPNSTPPARAPNSTPRWPSSRRWKPPSSTPSIGWASSPASNPPRWNRSLPRRPPSRPCRRWSTSATPPTCCAGARTSAPPKAPWPPPPRASASRPPTSSRASPSTATSACRPAKSRGLFKGGADTYSFGPSITWAALDLGHVLARIKAANARADAQLAAYEKTVLNALEETENALVDFGREQVRRDYLRTSERSATQAMTLARQRYEGGVDDFLPVLDAQRTQLAIQAQLAQSETRTATSLVAIYKALGGGWEIEQPVARTASSR